MCHKEADAIKMLNDTRKIKKIYEEHKILRKPRRRSYYRREILSRTCNGEREKTVLEKVDGLAL